jgi:uncharacterized protein (DUF1684 family)
MRNLLILIATLVSTHAQASESKTQSKEARMSDAQKFEKYKAEAEESLRSEGGWLTVVGLHWLQPGANPVGSASGIVVQMPKPMPEKFATILYGDDKKASIQFIESADVKLDGKPVAKGKSYALPIQKETAKSPEIKWKSITFFLIERPNGIGVRVQDNNSELRKNFKGRVWFDYDPKMKVTGKWVKVQPPTEMTVPDVLGNMRKEKVEGKVEFKLDGKAYALFPMVSGKNLFFIVHDLTSAKETYGSGRFLGGEIGKNDEVELDFNYLENPPCAFTPAATCPLPPQENYLQVKLAAGEKKPTGH